MSGPIRLLVVDDSVVVRSLLTRLIEQEDDLTLASTAVDGRQAVEKVRAMDFDVVILDVEMPVMTGVEALVEIRKIKPDLPVVMFSNLTKTGAMTTLEALSLGARDYAPKPQGMDSTSAFGQIRSELFAKIRQAHQIQQMRFGRSNVGTVASVRKAVTNESPRVSVQHRAEAIVLGASTGGPVAVETVLKAITRPLPVPMLIVQHMPPVFTKALAERLDKMVTSTVVEGEHGMKLEAGTVYIAPGGKHMEVERHPVKGIRIITNERPLINGCRPSVEPLYSSAIDVFESRLAAVMLTGVGRDGSDGAARIHANGCPVIVQDEATSVVWGMPGAIAQDGHATDVLPLDEIGGAILDLKLSGLAVAQ